MCHFWLKVISDMRILMTEDSNNAVSSSFLLDDDSRLNQRKKNMILYFILSFHSFSALLLPLTFFIGYAAFHFQSMTCPNQRIKWTFQMWNHRRLFMKIQASVSCYRVLTDSIFMAFLSTHWHVPFNLRITPEVQPIASWNLRLHSIYNSLSNFPYFCRLILSASPIHCSTSFWIFCCSLCCNLKNKNRKALLL